MRFLRTADVVSRTGLSRTTIWRMERSGRFPRRRQLGSTAVGWLEKEVEQWIETRGLAGSGDLGFSAASSPIRAKSNKS